MKYRGAGGALTTIVVSGVLASQAFAATTKGTSGPDRLIVKLDIGTTVFGSGGADKIVGGPGNDQLHGETGPDKIKGGPGDDLLDGLSADDQLFGEEGNDHLLGGFGHDTLFGGAGDDILNGGPAPDRVDGGDGNDQIHGGRAADVIIGGNGDDQVWPESGRDQIFAGPGNDTLHLNVDHYVGAVDCGEGIDTVVVPDQSGSRSTYLHYQRELGRTIVSCEIVVPRPIAADAHDGITKNMDFWGAGNIDGTELSDVLNGGHGSNVIHGFAGNDVIWVAAPKLSADQLTRARDQIDRADGGQGDDFIQGGPGVSELIGGDGDDVINGGIGDDRIDSGDGNDRIRVAGRSKDRIDGGLGDDKIDVVGSPETVVNCGPGQDVLRFTRKIKSKNCEQRKKIRLVPAVMVAAEKFSGPSLT